MILLVLAAIGATVLIFFCIYLIIGFVTKRKPLSYILGKKPRKIEWAFETLRILLALIGVSLLFYWQLMVPDVSQSRPYQIIFVFISAQLIMNVAYFCLLIYANYKNR